MAQAQAQAQAAPIQVPAHPIQVPVHPIQAPAAPIPAQFPYGYVPSVYNFPPPNSKHAPKMFTGKYNEVSRFFKKFDQQARNHRLTDAEKFEHVLEHVSSRVRDVIINLDTFQNAQWDAFVEEVSKLYNQDLEDEKYQIGNLHELIYRYQAMEIKKKKDYRDYQRAYIKIGGWLKKNDRISQDDYNRYFWYGIHHDMQRQIVARLVNINPNLDTTKAYPQADIDNAVKYIFSINTFYSKYDQRFRSTLDEDDSDSDTETETSSDEEDKYRRRHRHRKSKTHTKHYHDNHKPVHDLRPSPNPLPITASPPIPHPTSFLATPPNYATTNAPSAPQNDEIAKLIDEFSTKLTLKDPGVYSLYYQITLRAPDMKNVLPNPRDVFQSNTVSILPRPTTPKIPQASNVPTRTRTTSITQAMNKCYFCGEEGHMVLRCSVANDYINKKLISYDQEGHLVWSNGSRIYRHANETILEAILREQDLQKTRAKVTTNMISTHIPPPPVHVNFYELDQEITRINQEMGGEVEEQYLLTEEEFMQKINDIYGEDINEEAVEETVEEDEDEASIQVNAGAVRFKDTKEPERHNPYPKPKKFDGVEIPAKRVLARPIVPKPAMKTTPAPIPPVPTSSPVQEPVYQIPVSNVPGEEVLIDVPMTDAPKPKWKNPIKKVTPQDCLDQNGNWIGPKPSTTTKPPLATKPVEDKPEAPIELRRKFQSPIERDTDTLAVMNKLLDQPCGLLFRDIVGTSHSLPKMLGAYFKPTRIEVSEEHNPTQAKALAPIRTNTISLQKDDWKPAYHPQDARHLVIEVTFRNGYKVNALVDTGADNNVMDVTHFPLTRIGRINVKNTMTDAGMHITPLYGKCENVTLFIEDFETELPEVWLAKNSPYGIILGRSWLRKNLIHICEELDGTYLRQLRFGEVIWELCALPSYETQEAAKKNRAHHFFGADPNNPHTDPPQTPD